MDLHLSMEEFELLAEILQERHEAMIREISRADHREFKDLLKDRERRLQSIMDKIGVRVGA